MSDSYIERDFRRGAHVWVVKRDGRTTTDPVDGTPRVYATEQEARDGLLEHRDDWRDLTEHAQPLGPGNWR